MTLLEGIAASTIGGWLQKVSLRPLMRQPKFITLDLRGSVAAEDIEVIALTDEAKGALKSLQATTAGIMYAAGPASEYEGDPPEGSFSISRRTFLELESKGLVIFHQQGRKLDLTHRGWTVSPDTGKVDKIG